MKPFEEWNLKPVFKSNISLENINHLVKNGETSTKVVSL